MTDAPNASLAASPEIRRILVATDFSDAATAALQQAAALADRTQAELHVVHVAEQFPYAVYGASFDLPLALPVGDEQVLESEMRRISDERLAAALEPFGSPTRRITSETLVGVPFIEIIYAGQRRDCDLAIVGTHGAGFVQKMLIGGVAERLVRKAPFPVWAVRAGKPATPAAILAPTDFSATSEKSVRLAGRLARAFGAHLHVLHVIDAKDDVALPEGVAWRDNEQHRTTVQKAAQQHLEAFIGRHVPGDVACSPQLAVGAPWQKIHLAATHLAADLIVMGSLGRSGIPGLFLGNTAEKVLRYGDQSVVTLKPDDFISPFRVTTE